MASHVQGRRLRAVVFHRGRLGLAVDEAPNLVHLNELGGHAFDLLNQERLAIASDM